MIDRGTPVRAMHSDGQWYPATYVAERSSGDHRIRWNEGGEVAEVATVEPIGEVAKYGAKGKGASPSGKVANGPKGSRANRYRSKGMGGGKGGRGPGTPKALQNDVSQELRGAMDHHISQASHHATLANKASNEFMEQHHHMMMNHHHDMADKLHRYMMATG